MMCEDLWFIYSIIVFIIIYVWIFINVIVYDYSTMPEVICICVINKQAFLAKMYHTLFGVLFVLNTVVALILLNHIKRI